jgi:hypothetical protein
VTIERFYYYWTRRGNRQIAREVLQRARKGEIRSDLGVRTQDTGRATCRSS